MSSIRTFCVRWTALIAVAAGALAPVSQALAAEHPAQPATVQEVAAKR